MNQQRAFTLIELLVSIGIISLVSAVVFFNFPQFNQAVHLNRSAREVSIALREAQARAVAVTPLPDGTFPNNYGVFMEVTPSATPDGQYIIFSDLNNNLKYDTSNPAACVDECVKKNIFTNGIKITSLDIGGVLYTGLHIFYRRPDPVVIVSDQTGGCLAGNLPSSHPLATSCPASGSSYGPFTITISRPSGPNPSQVKKIEAYRTGQISIL